MDGWIPTNALTGHAYAVASVTSSSNGSRLASAYVTALDEPVSSPCLNVGIVLETDDGLVANRAAGSATVCSFWVVCPKKY